MAAIQQEAGQTIQWTELPSLGDGAAYTTGSYTISGQTFNGSAIYGLKGLDFYGFSDLALGLVDPDGRGPPGGGSNDPRPPAVDRSN